ncbi:hypothetical protein AB0J48_12765 [Nocardia salmonicida]|uniref:hypothetical protein n=1 Tax=Nocardia salmonicida TaxID=53431 RepID=UPI00342ED9A5
MLTEVVGQIERVLLQIQPKVGGSGVGRQLEIDEELVAAAKVLRMIEGGIDCALCEFDLLAQFGWRHQVRVGDIGADRGYRNPPVADLEAANSVCGARLGRILVRADGCCSAVVRRLIA